LKSQAVPSHVAVAWAGAAVQGAQVAPQAAIEVAATHDDPCRQVPWLHLKSQDEPLQRVVPLAGAAGHATAVAAGPHPSWHVADRQTGVTPAGAVQMAQVGPQASGLSPQGPPPPMPPPPAPPAVVPPVF